MSAAPAPLAELGARLGVTSHDASGEARDARLWAWAGRPDEARAAAERALSDAELRAEPAAAAEAGAVLALLDARTGDLERAVARWNDAHKRLSSAGRNEAATRALLDAAESLLDRDGPADISAAAAFLAEARAQVARVPESSPGGAALRTSLRLELARARSASGDHEGGQKELEAVEKDARGRDGADVAFRAHRALAQAHERRGEAAAAKKSWARAVGRLEDVVTALPRELREAFAADPRRTEARERAAGARREGARASDPGAERSDPGAERSDPGAERSDPGAERSDPGTERSDPGTEHGDSGAERSDSGSDAARDGRWARLLEITKRLATEHDLPRLLERITESAVDLSGAERGYVLLLEGQKLVPHAVRDASRPDDPHVAFSQSIAEAVLIDGEPIVTVDARADGRLSEYMSVHRLMLQSVACLPIRAGGQTLGVLYVENRVRRGRFAGADVELLLSFADQAAIALVNARMLAEIQSKNAELDARAEELAKANEQIERLLETTTSERDEARAELGRAREALGHKVRQGIVGESVAIRKVLSVVERVRDAGVPVVIHGESGTGKELVARAIHYGSARQKAPFVALNCAAVSETLLESELFGHEKGAFTGAERTRDGVFVRAHGGTLFLDEIGDMPGKMQVELLRVLSDGKVRRVGGEEEQTVDVRIVAASNKHLADLVEKGLFREDLFYRLAVVELKIPPLRERRQDIPLLAEHFLARHAAEGGGPRRRISRDALKRLMAHPLPGNVRQLEHLLLNACVMSAGDVLEAADLAIEGDGYVPPEASAEPAEAAASDDVALPEERSGPLPTNEDEWKAEERRRILAALEAASWNRVKAAAKMGIPRRTFYRRLKEYGILE